METTQTEGRKFRIGFVLLLVAAISALFLAVTWPFLQTLLLAAILAGLCRPLFSWLLHLCGGRRSLASALTLVILFILIAGPVSALVGLVVQQAIGVSNDAIPWLRQHIQSFGAVQAHDWLVHRFPSLSAYIPDQNKMVENAGNAAQSVGKALVGGASLVTANLATFLIDIFVMLYAMFFFFKDGTSILEKAFYYIPLRHEDELRMLERFTSVTRATVKGTLVIGLIQGTLAGIGFAFAGIGGAAFWGALMVILSVVPGIGATLIWLPAVVFLFLSGQTLPATLLAIWCAAVVGTVDNLLRPSLVGKDAKMPDLLILIGTLGGLYLFGPIGFIVGPVVCGLFLTVWEIYGATFKAILPPVRDLETGEIKPPEPALEEVELPSTQKNPEPETPDKADDEVEIPKRKARASAGKKKTPARPRSGGVKKSAQRRQAAGSRRGA